MAVDIRNDLRGLFGTARDQGQRCTCMAFAASDAHAAACGPFQPLSVEYAHYHAVRRKAVFAPEAGVPLHLMMAALKEDGQPAEADWPYLPTLPSDISLWRPPAQVGALFRRESVTGLPTVGTIFAHLDTGRPVVVVIMISQAFHYATQSKTISDADQTVDAGVHAMIAVGHGYDGSERVVLLRNSWGSSWCDEGNVWVSESYLARRLLGLAVMSQGDNTL